MYSSHVRTYDQNERMTDTKTRLLDTAERLFAERGFEAASLRIITRTAGVNLASVNYHFQSKEALIEALFARRLGPLNEERIQLLDGAEQRAAGGPAPLEEVIDAFIRPVLRMAEPNYRSMGVLFGRMYAEPGDLLRRLLTPQLEEIRVRFGRALQRSLPALSPEEIFWRMHFTIGALAHTLASRGLLEFLSGGRCTVGDVEQARKQLIQFAMGGLCAPPLEERP